MISTRSSRSMRSALSRKRRSKNQEILRFPRLSIRSRSCSASSASIIAIQGSYCVCGHLMVEDSGEHRKYMLSALNSFTIGNFYVRKDRPRGYRYGKAPGCKEYHTAHQLAKKCRKKGYDSIYDRYMRDKLFRSNMIDHGRTEKVIIDMDNLANENRSFKVSQNEIDYYRQKLVGTLKRGT